MRRGLVGATRECEDVQARALLDAQNDEDKKVSSAKTAVAITGAGNRDGRRPFLQQMEGHCQSRRG